MATAFYRKYRPDNFENIVGQNQVIDVLRNQIKENKISHAYLFSGVRGTGKTSTAKVFARAVNCKNYDDVKGPCNKCESCINNEMDTVEIDAASNNSVDNIRELKENIMYQPSFGRYKVYIIDEVHMLSSGAFNALLKTLEEPPEHVIFILATTEIQKIPSTILSRCQKFEFKKINKTQITDRLKEILDLEKIPYDDQAIDYIASRSDGGLRDAISMLDQVSAFDRVNLENINFILGNTSIENVDRFLRGYITKDAGQTLKITTSIINDSIDIKKFPVQIINRLRDIIFIQNKVEKNDIIDMESARNIAEQTSQNAVTDLIVKLSEVENKMKFSMTPDILFQAFAVKICKTVEENGSSKNEQMLLNRIEKLENRINMLEQGQVNLPLKDSQNTIQRSKPIQRPTVKDIKQKDTVPEEEQKQINIIKSLENDIEQMLKNDYKCAHIGAFYRQGEIRRYVNDTIYVSFSRTMQFHKNKLQEEKNLQIFEEVLSKILNKKTTAVIIFDDEIINPGENTNQDNTVQKIKEVFGQDVNLEIIKE